MWSEEARKKKSKQSKDLWKNKNYREVVARKVSEGQKRAWKKNKNRPKPRKEPYYHLLKEAVEKEGYEVLTSLEDYIIGDSYITLRCPNEHLFKVTFKEFVTKKKRCPDCRTERYLVALNEVLDSKNYTLESMEFTYNRWILPKDIEVTCPKGHTTRVDIGNFINGHECNRCKNYISDIEYQIQAFLDLHDINYLSNPRTIISPYELDFYIPSSNLAIEFDGYPYHCEIKGGKDKNYHLNKTELCESKGIQLIHIFWDEWKDNYCLVQKKLLHLLGKSQDKRIFARKCRVKKISAKRARKFCEENHIQGYSNASIKLGLFHENELVSVMTFSIPSKAKGRKRIEGHWELNRFCSSCNVIGGASKLLSYFKKNYEWSKIFTYADRRWSIGKMYKQIGFNLLRKSKQNYWYTGNEIYGRAHRFKYRKSVLKGKGTEWEIMSKNGYDRVWDCGNLVFEMDKEV